MLQKTVAETGVTGNILRFREKAESLPDTLIINYN